MNILITAVGSELSFSIIKAIKKINPMPKLIGCDIYKDVVGKFWVDEFINVPKAQETKAYKNKLIEIIRQYGILVIIPTSDAEILLLSSLKKELKEKYNCYVLTNSDSQQELFNDKWLAYKWYISNKINCPKTFDRSEVQHIDSSTYPLIVKPKIGGGSRSIYKANNKEELLKFIDCVPDPIIQEHIGDDNNEFTAGTFKTNKGEVFVIVLKRKLKFGMTNSATVIDDCKLNSFCKNIISKSGLIGANNIQFRIDNEIPKVIEINPRFSGTTGIRAEFGFNEVEMWLTDLFEGTVEPPKITKGSVLRYMEEIYSYE